MVDFLRSQFDKLLLAALICFMIGAVIHLVHAGEANQAAAQALGWLEKSIDIMTGGLIGIVTGRALSQGGR